MTLARVAETLGRRFGVIGQAMERMMAVARSTGYWPEDLPEVVAARHLGYLPREEVFAVCTGSQGEPRSALARIATTRHRDLLLDHGDRVIFSSRLIPGNERAVEKVQQRLRDFHIEIITDRDERVHVSGHPAQDDLRRLYNWIQPTSVIPVHGTPRHLAANAAIARACHVPDVRIAQNGDVYSLSKSKPARVGHVDTGRLTLRPDGGLQAIPPETLQTMRENVH